MKKRKRSWLTYTLALALTAAMCAGTALAGAPGDMMGMPPGGATDMSPAGPPGDGAPDQAAIYLENGALVAEKTYVPGAYDAYVTTDGLHTTITGLDMTSGDYTFNGIVAKGAGSSVTLDKCTILLTVDAPASSDMTCGSAVAVDDGATMYINDSTLTVDGSARYVVSAYNDAVLVVHNSAITSTGKTENTLEIAEPFSNEALLISGNARSNFSIGATKTYYFNSKCIAEGWAALSTDSATGDGLDLYAYNTQAVAQNGGYATYADTNCRVWLYGSDLKAAEIGAIISKSGSILVADTAETPEEVLVYNPGETAEASSVLTGGRNAVMIHAPDMMGQGVWAADCGTLTVRNSKLATTRELVSTKDYHDYGDAVAAYVDYVSGADILVRSTSANITLDNAELESYSGVLVLTVLNSDSMGNFLDEGDGWEVEPVTVVMQNMEAEGDIRHMDYHRFMTLELDNAALTGAVVSGNVAQWNALWADYAVEDCNWVVDEDFASCYGVQMTLKNGAVWNVTEMSTLSSLTVEAGATVNGCLVVNGQITPVEEGRTYTGRLYVLPETPAELTDVSQLADFDELGQEAVLLLEQGLLSAVPTAEGQWMFGAETPVTRAEAAHVLANALTEEIPAAASAAFSDTADSWAADSIAYLAAQGIVNGDDQGAYRPNDAITVGQAAKMLLAAQGVTGLTGEHWQEAVALAAEEAGILEPGADLDAVLTRAMALEMSAGILETLQGA